MPLIYLHENDLWFELLCQHSYQWIVPEDSIVFLQFVLNFLELNLRIQSLEQKRVFGQLLGTVTPAWISDFVGFAMRRFDPQAGLFRNKLPGRTKHEHRFLLFSYLKSTASVIWHGVFFFQECHLCKLCHFETADSLPAEFIPKIKSKNNGFILRYFCIKCYSVMLNDKQFTKEICHQRGRKVKRSDFKDAQFLFFTLIWRFKLLHKEIRRYSGNEKGNSIISASHQY